VTTILIRFHFVEKFTELGCDAVRVLPQHALGRLKKMDNLYWFFCHSKSFCGVVAGRTGMIFSIAALVGNPPCPRRDNHGADFVGQGSQWISRANTSIVIL
jgi:hypothetical protein